MTDAVHISCAEVETLLCDYVDETLDRQRKAVVQKHLSDCPTCAEMARDAATAVAFTKRVSAVDPPDELVTRLLFQTPRGRYSFAAGWYAFLRRLLEPVLQPRFAMGMAMTILSFSLIGRFAGIPKRELTAEDLHPAKVWEAVDYRLHRTWDRIVKYYENLRVVYEIQSRLSEWSDERNQQSQTGSPSQGQQQNE